MDNLFIESNEQLGLLYNSYKVIPNKIKKFLDILEKYIDKSNNDEVPTDLDELKNALDKFKEDMELDKSTPSEIDPLEYKKIKHQISSTKDETIDQLNRLAKLRKIFKYGDNLFNGIIKKPKVYQNTIDGDKLDSVNKWMRLAARCLDWSEKYILDLMNLIDQDLNLLTVVNKLYFRKIFEDGVNIDYDHIDILSENINSENIFSESYNIQPDLLNENINISTKFESWFDESTLSTIHDEEDDDLLNSKITDNDEEYYPIFSVVMSYDFENADGDIEAKKLTRHGKTINSVTKGDQYTHTLVSFDTSFNHMWHFVATGFEPVDLKEHDAARVTKSIYVAVSYLNKTEIDAVMKVVKTYKKEKDKTAYSINQLINQFFGKATHNDKRQICSSLIAYLLSVADVKNLPRDYSLIRPEDITILPRSFYVMTFKNRDDFFERHEEFEKRVQDIYDENIDDIREYNNIIPKVMLKDTFKKRGKIDAVVDFFINKLYNKESENPDNN